MFLEFAHFKLVMLPSIFYCVHDCERPGAVLFNAGCNEQVFFPEPRKKIAQIRLVVFEKNAKTAHFNSKNDVTKPKARLL